MIGKFSIVSASALIGIATAAQAAPLWNMTFEEASHVVGQAPNTTPPNTGGVSSNPTAAVGSNNGSVLVQNGYTNGTTSSSLSSKLAVLSRTGNPGTSYMLMQGDPADEVSTGVYTLSFDWIEGPDAVGSFFIGVTNQARSAGLTNIFFDMGENVGNIRSANDSNWGATLGTAARGFAHHMDWVMNLDATDPLLFSQIYVDGVFLNNQREEVGNVSLGAFSIGHSVGTGAMAFDNIVLQAGEHIVPEPASLSLLGLGALVLRRRK